MPSLSLSHSATFQRSHFIETPLTCSYHTSASAPFPSSLLVQKGRNPLSSLIPPAVLRVEPLLSSWESCTIDYPPFLSLQPSSSPLLFPINPWTSLGLLTLETSPLMLFPPLVKAPSFCSPPEHLKWFFPWPLRWHPSIFSVTLFILICQLFLHVAFKCWNSSWLKAMLSSLTPFSPCELRVIPLWLQYCV